MPRRDSGITVAELRHRRVAPRDRATIEASTFETYERDVQLSRHAVGALKSARPPRQPPRRAVRRAPRVGTPATATAGSRRAHGPLRRDDHPPGARRHGPQGPGGAQRRRGRRPAEREEGPGARDEVLDARARTASVPRGRARPARCSPAFRLAALTGLRRGELFGLLWRDVDLDAATITVQRQLP